MNILFVAWSNQQSTEIYADPSVWYRCFQPAQALRELGHIANVVDYRQLEDKHVNLHDCLIFFRPQYSKDFVELINQCEKSKKRYIASYDDLFFDIGHLRHSGFRKLAAPQEQILSHRPELYAKAFYFFEEFISSTDGLKKAILAHKPQAKVYLHYNGIPPEIYNLAKLLTAQKNTDVSRIGYFAGGAIHTPDLKRITPMLQQVLGEQNAIFYCAETVQIPAELKATGRIETTPRMNYSKMIRAYAKCSVTVAPLEINDFTNSKSGIKFLESAILGNQVVASPIQDILRVGNEMLFTAISDDDWYNQLTLSLTKKLDPETLSKYVKQLICNHSCKAEATNFINQFNAQAD